MHTITPHSQQISPRPLYLLRKYAADKAKIAFIMAFLLGVCTLTIFVVICCAAQVVSSRAVLQDSFAQGIHFESSPPEYIRRTFRQNNGLPQNSAFALCQTRDGYIWIGTQEGLVRYDGNQFVIFDKSTVPEITGNFIYALKEDRQGRLWIGTSKGLISYHEGRFTKYTAKHELPDNPVRSLLEDSEGVLWIGAKDGLASYKGDKFTVYSAKDGLPQKDIWSLLEDSNGRIWIGTNDGGINIYHKGAFIGYTKKNGLSGNIVRALVEDRFGTVWIGTKDGGIDCFKDGRLYPCSAKIGAPVGVHTLFEDRSGSVWIGTQKGLTHYQHGVFAPVVVENDLFGDGVYSLFEDREGGLWVGTDGGGVHHYRNARFTTFTTKNGLLSDCIWSLLRDRSGVLWVGTNGGGLHYYKNQKFTALPIKDFSNERITALLEDLEGAIWVGATGVLGRLKDNKFSVIATKKTLTNNRVRALLEDRTGKLWVGTSGGGLHYYKDGKFTTLTTQHGLSNSAVISLLVDRNGTLWIGTLDGLNRYENDKFTTYTTQNGLSSNAIMSLLEDREGTIWIGTFGGGVCRLKGGKFTSYRTQDGLFNDVAYCILEDDMGYLWMSCNKGIYRVLKQDLEDFSDGKISRIPCCSFGSADGMKTAECNGGSNPAGWKDHEGSLWFATAQGVVTINPKKINFDTPHLILEKVVTDRNIALHAQSFPAEIPASTEKMEFHYTAPLFVAPERARFKYMLEGYDREWVEAGKRRVAYYTNLPRGRSYRFRVIAECEGRWDKTGVNVPFRVASYYWETWWFYAAALVIICGMVYQGVQYRTEKLQARTLELERVVEERTQKLQKAHEESEALLLNILPAPIARRLKFGEEYIADYYPHATILFADLCGFTRFAATMKPQEVVVMLNTIFTHFDAIAHKHGVEKIKTIGDAYMIVGGVPDQCADHVAKVARAALEIQTTLPTLFFEKLIGITARIGIHTGEVVAGVIGASKFSYDMWGDTVNVASRMESHGEPGKIHCSHDVYLALREQFLFEPCGDQYVKGKGTMQTWFLVGAR